MNTDIKFFINAVCMCLLYFGGVVTATASDAATANAATPAKTLQCPCWKGVPQGSLITAIDNFFGLSPRNAMFCSKSAVIPENCAIRVKSGLVPSYTYVAKCQPPLTYTTIPILFHTPEGAWWCSGPSIAGARALYDNEIPLCISEAKAELKDTSGLCLTPPDPSKIPAKIKIIPKTGNSLSASMNETHKSVKLTDGGMESKNERFIGKSRR